MCHSFHFHFSIGLLACAICRSPSIAAQVPRIGAKRQQLVCEVGQGHRAAMSPRRPGAELASAQGQPPHHLFRPLNAGGDRAGKVNDRFWTGLSGQRGPYLFRDKATSVFGINLSPPSRFPRSLLFCPISRHLVLFWCSRRGLLRSHPRAGTILSRTLRFLSGTRWFPGRLLRSHSRTSTIFGVL
jgi:hypothetical protein